MFRIALRGVRHNTGRYLATLIAIATGVAFFTAVSLIGDGVTNSLFGAIEQQYSAVGAAVVPAGEGDSGGFAEPLAITGATADDLLAVDGVEGGAGELSGPVAFSAADGSTFGQGATGRLWMEDAELNPLQIVEGSAPSAAGEVAIDRNFATDNGLSVGSTTTLLSVSGPTPVTIVGISAFGDTNSVDSSGTVSISAPEAFTVLRGGEVEYDTYLLRTSGLPSQVVDRLQSVVPSGFIAQTGDQFRTDKEETIGSFGTVLKTALQAFALLALFVGAFVIYNTFTVIVAQRQRELAVFSAIGATPKQIKRSLRSEGLLIGLLGSALGLVLGVVLAFLLLAAIKLFGVELSGGGIAITPGTVIQGLLFGTVITYLSVTIPARRAARIEPIEALRDAEVETDSGSRSRGISAAVLVGLGLVAMFVGSSPTLIGLGVLFLVVGVIVGGPFIAVGGSKVFRTLFSAFGLEGRLAVDNSIRNPKRTATTANALLIGVFLVTLVTVAGTSAKDFSVAQIQQLESADYLISSDGGTIDDELVNQLSDVPDVNAVTPYRRESVTVDGQPSLLSTADIDALVAATNLSATEGSLDDLTDGTVAVSPVTSGDAPTPTMGDTITVVTKDGATADLEVVAVLAPSIDTTSLGNLANTATFDDLVGATAPTAAFIDVKSGAQTETKDAIEELVAKRPDITASEGNAVGQLLGTVFDFLINAVNGLLVMSVLVALIGIVNTLSLSILERRRELGLLRIMGMVDAHVRRMVRLEAALIAALGTITGMVLGLVVGWGLVAAINRLAEAGIGYSFPAVLLGVVLVLGIALGFAAPLLPARRSTRLEVLDAIAAT